MILLERQQRWLYATEVSSRATPPTHPLGRFSTTVEYAHPQKGPTHREMHGADLFRGPGRGWGGEGSYSS